MLYISKSQAKLNRGNITIIPPGFYLREGSLQRACVRVHFEFGRPHATKRKDNKCALSNVNSTCCISTRLICDETTVYVKL